MSEEMEMNLEQPAENSAETVSDEILSAAEEVTAEAEAAESEATDSVDAGDAEEEKAKWYVVHTYSGYENKVKVNLEKTIENRHLQDQILEVLVPLQDVVETDKNNKSKVVQRKIFPGYVLVKMDMNDETWYVVRNTRGVTGFVGPGSKPVPLTDAEMKPLGIKTNVVSVNFDVGDEVAVIAGVWKDTKGYIQRMDLGKQTATINVDLFGRETPVEISFAEVRKID
jgi:transcriptional antiterminator NusG